MVKKDIIRDYATEAFRIYSLLGKPTAEQIKAKIKDKAVIANVAAVETTLEYFKLANKPHIIKAVEAVYFSYPKRHLKKKEITERITSFAVSYGAGERTVYYWLKEARDVFADFRGLKMKDKSLQ